MSWLWWWILTGLLLAALVTAGILSVIEWSHSERPRSDWDRVRAALRRAVERNREV